MVQVIAGLERTQELLNALLDEWRLQDLVDVGTPCWVHLQAIVNQSLHIRAVFSWDGLVLTTHDFLTKRNEVLCVERRSL